jgi:hypothetical protein
MPLAKHFMPSVRNPKLRFHGLHRLVHYVAQSYSTPSQRGPPSLLDKSFLAKCDPQEHDFSTVCTKNNVEHLRIRLAVHDRHDFSRLVQRSPPLRKQTFRFRRIGDHQNWFTSLGIRRARGFAGRFMLVEGTCV